MDGTDEAVIAQVRAGDRDAFRVLVDRHSRSIFRLAYRMVGNESDADDVVQETFLKAFKQIGRFEERSNFGTWLHRIAVNCSFDLLRERPRHETPLLEKDDEQEGLKDPDPGPSPERVAYSA